MKKKLVFKKINIPPKGIHLWLNIEGENLPKHSGVIIDTGASMSVFDPEIMKNFLHDIENSLEMDVASGVNADIENPQTGKLSGIQIDGFTIDNLEVGIMNLEHIRNIYKEHFDYIICGLLGSDFLDKFDAQIDYKQSNLILYTD